MIESAAEPAELSQLECDMEAEDMPLPKTSSLKKVRDKEEETEITKKKE